MYEILDHPSDVGILARGMTREQALIEASRGLVSIMVNSHGVSTTEARDCRASGPDEVSQIVNWLNEILFFFDTESLVFTQFEIAFWNEREIVGEARGGFFDSSQHEFRTAVKAATFHQIQSHASPEGWEIRVFVDV